MKGFLSRALATVALTLCALPIAAQTTPTYSDETVISFLGIRTVGINSDKMTQEDLMNLLDENSKKYVESIEWSNICTWDYVQKEPAKIGLQLISDYSKTSSITIHFKNDCSFNAGRIILYGGVGHDDQYGAGISDGTQRKLKVTINDDFNIGTGASALNPVFNYKFSNISLSLDQLIEEMGKLHSASAYYAQDPNYRILRTKDSEKFFPLKSIKIEHLSIPKKENSVRKIALHGIKILHNGFVENDINTGVEEIAQENGAVEYFDLYGRRLADKPTQGLFIEKRGSKVTKLLAR